MMVDKREAPLKRCMFVMTLIILDLPSVRVARVAATRNQRTTFQVHESNKSLYDTQVPEYEAPLFTQDGFSQRSREILDWFSQKTGIGNGAERIAERNVKFREAVRMLVKDEEFYQAAQFSVCVRTSPTRYPYPDDVQGYIDMRCTTAMEILDTEKGNRRESHRRLSLSDVYEDLGSFLNDLEIPDLNDIPRFSRLLFEINKWSGMDLDEQDDPKAREASIEQRDHHFSQMFHAYAQLKAHKLSCGDVTPRGKLVQELLGFPVGMRFRKASPGHGMMRTVNESESDSDSDGEEWPPYKPEMTERFALCFGELAAPGQQYFSAKAVATTCTGFWDKDIAVKAVLGLGSSLKSEAVEDTMFRVRSEILFGKAEGTGKTLLEKDFHMVGGHDPKARSARRISELVGRLVRSRIMSTGIKCPRCIADYLGVETVETDAAANSSQAKRSSSRSKHASSRSKHSSSRSKRSSSRSKIKQSLLQLDDSDSHSMDQFVPPYALLAVAQQAAAPPGPLPVDPFIHAQNMVATAPHYEVMVPGMIAPTGVHVAAGPFTTVSQAPHIIYPTLNHAGHATWHGAVSGQVTGGVPLSELMGDTGHDAWHFITEGGKQSVVVHGAGGTGAGHCIGLGAQGHLQADVAVKLGTMPDGGTGLITKVFVHGKVAAAGTMAPLKVIGGAIVVKLFHAVILPAAVVVCLITLMKSAAYYGVNMIKGYFQAKRVQKKLQSWQTLMEKSRVEEFIIRP
eukprot:TRINITY_DN4737_c0_g1_i2.p1 TRINITY_DN4737_c0_g1~~TRINITY_DN4737_c0_g1_i2.p1  ORF type:complete len:737 (-),score=90.88 TRINITY_DN4737_c0_g1_i2:53-2263(-)